MTFARGGRGLTSLKCPVWANVFINGPYSQIWNSFCHVTILPLVAFTRAIHIRVYLGPLPLLCVSYFWMAHVKVAGSLGKDTQSNFFYSVHSWSFVLYHQLTFYCKLHRIVWLWHVREWLPCRMSLARAGPPLVPWARNSPPVSGSLGGLLGCTRTRPRHRGQSESKHSTPTTKSM